MLKRLLFLAMALPCVSYGQQHLPVAMELHEGWTFRQARGTNRYPATVPGVVHTDLMDNGLIENPYFRLNERSVQWVDKEDWIYETVFDLPEEFRGKQHTFLHFNGLDTYADVFLNDEKILEADNMFREWRIDVKGRLNPTGNRLRIYFHSPIGRALPLWEASPIRYRASNDQSENGGVFDRKVSVFTRKAGYHYGWDWGPRLVTSGIWRPVTLEAWNDARIENVYITQPQVDSRNASLRFFVEVEADRDITGAELEVSDRSTGRTLSKTATSLVKGLNRVEIAFDLKNPRLWWTNGLGDPHLYTFDTRLRIGDQIRDERTERIGIRSLEVVREPDASGTAFYFKLNGHPIFTKGANYIPSDLFLPRVTRAVHERTIRDAVAAHMNMLRVWGGGIYEEDDFYDLCDENGILVWQDFAFACSVYPAEGALLENIRQEAVDNIRRLRNHASLALWCGNNEIMDALFHWGPGGWLGQYREEGPGQAETVWQQYLTLFHEMLPEVVREHDPQTYYLPSSPFSDMEGSRDISAGDYHYWTTWQQGLPVATFADTRSRYFSEYGYQSFPEWNTVRQYAPQENDRNIYSETMMWHQRGGITANQRIEQGIEREYGCPKDFASLLYLSQVLQADAMKTAIEAHRRDMPYCMGSLYWQLNDCWPVASWSGIDYYRRWKALHYTVREAFRDVLVSPVEKEGSLEIHVVSDRLSSFRGKLEMRATTLQGELLWKSSRKITVPANTSTLVRTKPLEELLGFANPKEAVIRVTLTDPEGNTYENLFLPKIPREMEIPGAEVHFSVVSSGTGIDIRLCSETYAHAVMLSLDDPNAEWEDNYFSLLPGEPRKVRVRTALPMEEVEKQLRIFTLTDAIIR